MNNFQNPWDKGGELYNQNALNTQFLPEGFLETKQSFQEWKKEREQNKSITNTTKQAYLVNDSDYTIYFKPEEKMTVAEKEYKNGIAYPLAPKQSWYYAIDGLAAPYIKKEMVYKLNNTIRAHVSNKKVSWRGGNFFSKIGQSTWFDESGGWKDKEWLNWISSDINIVRYKHFLSGAKWNKTIWDKTNSGGGDKSWVSLFKASGLKNTEKYLKRYTYYSPIKILVD